MKNIARQTSELCKELAEWIGSSSLSQPEIARKAGVNQATVSRVLKRMKPRKKMTIALEKLCNYAKIEIYTSVAVEPKKNRLLMGALEYAWDGTPSHARRIAKVIRQLSTL